jgi:diguanylate cyclase (GGDEF)-like protein/PAS domain S-box-containing protein
MDDHATDQRVRQVRLGMSVAAVVATFGGLELFGIADPRGAMVYLLAAVLLLITVAAFASPRVVVVLGVLAGIGYSVLLPMHAGTGPLATVVLTAMMACVVGQTALNARTRRNLDARRRKAEQRAETLLGASADAVLTVGRDGTIKYVSPALDRLLGYRPADLVGSRLADVLPAERRVQGFLTQLFARPLGESARAETRLRGGDGGWVYVDVMGTNWVDDPDLQAAVISLRDIGARRELEEQLSRQAYLDSLTGLPNRARFRECLATAVAASTGPPVTVLLLDLDDFKLVNDNLGHSAGDELLGTVADRLRGLVREEDLLARLGGDEFGILLHEVEPAAAAALAERLLSSVHEPIRLGSRDLSCSLSIGIATSAGCADPGDGDGSAEMLLTNADLAMYAAKRAGRNGYAVFDPTMTASVLEEAQLRADLERGLEHEEFVVLYQPVVDMQTQRLISVEALVRWQHPRDGLLGPHHFIAAAEANGLIVPLGRWVLREACAQLAQWRATAPDAAGLHVNVNLSARQFQYAGLVDDVSAALADAGVDPASLTLEITESMLMADIETAKATLHALRRLGVRLAIDDFGTGYSSLSYLKQLPVDVIKIDKTFVDEVHVDDDDVALVDAVAGLGQALKMQTVAEGIETGEQWDTLRRLGIDHGQGYLFGRPAAPGEIAGLLEGNDADLAV